MRHACNIFGYDYVSKKMKKSIDRIIDLCESLAHGSNYILEALNCKEIKYRKIIKDFEKEFIEIENKKLLAIEKNENLIEALKEKRKTFCEIGTNKAKRRLNKLSQTSNLAKAIRIAIEIEDKNICAKKCYGDYQDRIYRKKTELILDLKKLFEIEKWIFGVQKSDIPGISHIIYFEIPECEQISWHFTPPKDMSFPDYLKEWDQKENSTLDKLEVLTKKILNS